MKYQKVFSFICFDKINREHIYNKSNNAFILIALGAHYDGCKVVHCMYCNSTRYVYIRFTLITLTVFTTMNVSCKS